MSATTKGRESSSLAVEEEGAAEAGARPTRAARAPGVRAGARARPAGAANIEARGGPAPKGEAG